MNKIIINEYPVKYIKTPEKQMRLLRYWYEPMKGLANEGDVFVNCESFDADVLDGGHTALNGKWFKACLKALENFDGDLLFVTDEPDVLDVIASHLK